MDSTEREITVRELRQLKNKESYEVWDERMSQWVPIIGSTYEYQGPTGFSSTTNPYAPINAIAIHHMHTDRSIVIAVPPPGWNIKLLDKSLLELSEIVLVKNEKELLLLMLDEFVDSDVLSGWNSDTFDIPYIAKRIEKTLGKAALRRLSFDGADMPRYREVEIFKQAAIMCDLSGRVHLDYLNLFRKYEVSERPSYKLESIADEVLPHLPKLEYEGSLADLYKKDFNHFIRYNIRDTEILKGFEQKLGYIALANVMCHSSTSQFKDVFGTLKLSDFAVVNYCHYELNVKVPDWSEKPDGNIQGAYVLLPQIGMHEWIGSIDINSLYPSAIRSINISPETLIGQFTENVQAWEEIAAGSDKLLTFEYDTGEVDEMTADEWRGFLIEQKWAVSGFGTVFNQSKQGIVPTILASWYKQRKQYQKLMNQLYEEAQQYKETDREKYTELMEKSAYNNRLQYVFKIKLNSFYGALTNYYFRFFDLRAGESTTGTGRAILRHQIRKTAEVLDGNYNINPPLDADSFAKSGGVFPSESIIYGDSVAGNTSIDITGGHRINISDLFSSISYTDGGREYCNLNETVSALTYDESTNSTTYRPIKYVMRHKTSKQMYRVWITNSQYVDVTEDHSLIGYVNTRMRYKFGGKITAEVKPTQITRGARSLLYVKHKPHNGNQQFSGLSSEMYSLMGYVVGDGYVDTTATGGVLLSIGDKHIQDVEDALLVPLKEQGWISSWCIKPNKHDVQISSVKLRKYLRKTLYLKGTKRIPLEMLQETPHNIQSFLRGLFTADGFININHTVGLCSVDENTIKTVQELLFRCGISSTWFTETTENSFKGKFSNTFTKRLTVKSTDEFKQKVGFIVEEKQKRLLSYVPGKRKKAMKQYDFEIVNVHHTEKLPIREQYVYDIEVDDTHVFFANNILVHNTDSVYFNTHGQNQQEATQIADATAEMVNRSYQPFMKQAFLCNPGFDDIIKCGREVVSDRGIFVDKKRYVLHLVDLDGHIVDKMKIMGLELKKTTLPKPIAKKLSSFVERLLKGDNWDTIATDIVEFKTSLDKTTDIMTIGLPKGVKGVEDYTKAWLLDGKTRLPGHVAASIFYNNQLDEYEDKESMRITSNMKIKVFYLTRTFGRFKSIAIPTDLTILPQWFVEHFYPLIDRDAQLQRLVDDTLQHIFTAINREVPTPQSMFVDSMLEF